MLLPCHFAQIGHIEDVVVSGDYRGKNLGYKSLTCRTLHTVRHFLLPHLADLLCDASPVCVRLIAQLLAVSRSAGCYKVILDCDDQNVPFYEKLGFKKHVNHMRFDYKSKVRKQVTG